MLKYGWRVAFATGVLPVFLAFYIRRRLPESPEFEKAREKGESEKAPFLNLLRPPALWDFIQVFVFMSGLFLTDYPRWAFADCIQ